ncbi:DUF452 family protein [Sphingobacterium prati]|uniref:DUF452 family protein n=1 Tax=Sphingobacterium prati TaxID=2737006 RepID=UPI00155368AC|nr:pimeloyl-ACP methyl esterase BioG family protein [Sphingobacterium prati]NPE49467.1 DUF452 family protein [Sphingobacterium prati]
MKLEKIIPVPHVAHLSNSNLLNHSVPSNKKLILFFAGWGMDQQPFLTYAPSNWDLIVAYDYYSLAIDESLLKGYDEIRVFAWSFGVWAASQVVPGLQSKSYPLLTCSAINGTPFPINDQKGIPTQLFRGTLDSLSEGTLYKFRLRMCGSGELLQHFLANVPKRNIESLRKELFEIEKQVTESSVTALQWDHAYIGRQDRIFSPENQRRAWEHTPHTFFNAGHYAEKLFKALLQEI